MPFFGFGGRQPEPPQGTRVDPARSARLDATIADQIRDGEPGLAIAVVKDNAVAHLVAYGLADAQRNVPAKTDTMFHLASCGKQFTALGILKLVEAGRVVLDDPIGLHLPAIAGFGAEVTIRRLLNHTSGIRDLYDEDGYQTVLSYAARPTNADIIAVYAKLGCPMAAAPGAAFVYSNSGYELLGAVIERAAGESYANFFRRIVFDPVKMNDTFSVPDRRMNDPRRAIGYGSDNDGFYEHEGSEFDDLVGAGSFVTTAPDLCLYDAALNANAVVSEASMRLALTDGKTNDGKNIGYGLGWYVDRDNVGPYAEHDGDWAGFYSWIRRYLDRSLSIYVLTNNPEVKLKEVADAASGAFADLVA